MMPIMALFKRTISLLIAVSFVFAGVPAQAMSVPCPMAKMQAEMQVAVKADMPSMKMDMKNCEGCPKSVEEKQVKQTKKNGCCDDSVCKAKCASFTSAAPFLPVAFEHASMTGVAQKFFFGSDILASAFLSSQDKPPKYLS